MAEDSWREVRVILSPAAEDDLDDIWLYNFEVYGVDHADTYLAFLKSEALQLSVKYRSGKAYRVRGFYIISLQFALRGHRHYAVYEFDERTIRVSRFVHSAQKRIRLG